MAQPLNICMLNADIPVPAVTTSLAPTYGRIFHSLLSSATTSSSSTTTITSTDYNVVAGEYPSSLAAYHGIIISGSANSAYDDLPWIKKLITYIEYVYEHEPHIKIFGSCFGHQIVCGALLGEYGVEVEKDAKGWELGVREITLHDEFLKTFSEGEGMERKMQLQFVHHDHVVVPDMDALPSSWVTVGSTSHCAVQGVYERGRVFTLQGHFEFDRFVNAETIKYFFADWQPKVLEETLEAIDKDDDSVVAARMVLKFFEEKVGECGAKHSVVGGLLTPPQKE